MNRIELYCASTALMLCAAASLAAPTVFPTGTTLYDPVKTWNGFTILSNLDNRAALIIDMNGTTVKHWDDVFNVSAGGPARILPGGYIVAASGNNPPHQESRALVQTDFDGKEMWRWDHNEQISDADGNMAWSARQHHDWQRSDYPAGYYSPETNPAREGVNTLLLTHANRVVPAVSAGLLEDDHVVEVNWEGEVQWEWYASDHVGEFGFSPAAREVISASADNSERGYDWLHINALAYVGPNKWYDAGDARFAPENVVISSRQAGFVAVIARDGSVVWQIGPDVMVSEAQKKIGQIIGQHNVHFIPKGLPGAGNVIIFDNGGSSGYGAPTPVAQDGVGIYGRSNSRVLEINPVTLELVWSYTAANFFSTNISGAQRLENGNTLITEGAPGRIFEVTPDKEIVWEYMNAPGDTGRNSVYRAYRVPYSWVPQLARPQERAIRAPVPFVLPADNG